ncbi:MAG TPA: DUF4097 family beta strand repeat-containing protein [Candidatus Angelobacter sp.]|nr:DUF4097 family beta strand repeat-containing protein [Candidatus Angelobacter sp.]
MKLFPTNAAAGIATRPAGRSALLVAATLLLSSAYAADTRKESRLDIAPGGNVTIVNNGGSVTLHSAGSGRQVLIAYTTHSDKVEVDQNATPDKQRIELLTHAIAGQKPTAEEARVDYELTVPAGISVNVTTVSAPITSDGLAGDISLSSETGQIDVHNMSKSHLHARSMTAPVSLTAITGTYIDVQSSGGAVHLSKVTGPRVAVATANGNIDYHGDCAGGGDYRFSTHSGDIEMWLPAYASVDLSARSRSGAVDNEFPLEEKQHQVNPPIQGRSFAGTSNSGSSSVELQSISGKIRVKKQ